MGQSASSERQPQHTPHIGASETPNDYEALEEGHGVDTQEQDRLLGSRERRWNGFRSGASGLSRLASGRPRHTEHGSTYRRETRARSTLISPNSGPDSDTHARDDVVLEQEERPLISSDLERLNDAPITDIQGPMPRRASVLSRLGSRVISRGSPRAAPRRPARESEERLTTDAANNSSASEHESTAARSRRNRFSMFDLPTRPEIPHEDIPRRNSLSGTYPSPSDIPSGLEVTSLQDGAAPPAIASRQQQASAWERSDRGGRFRRNVVAPLGGLFHRNQNRPLRSRNTSYSQPQSGGGDETRNLISPQGTGTTIPDQRASNARSTAAEQGTEANPVELDGPEQRSWLPGSRGSDQNSDSRRNSRRLQHMLGGRSSRLIRREDDTPLSRVLQLAAAAIARQLSGVSDSSPDLQSVGDDHFDGSLNTFIQSLNNAAEQSINDENNPTNSNLPPLNFWRVFRFVNNRSGDSASGLNQHPPGVDGESPASRLVTLVVVGVRSVPSSSVLNDTAGALNTNLDGLLALPTTPPEGLNLGQGLQSVSASGSRNRLQRRRTSISANNPFPSQYDSQRHQGSTSRLSRTTGLNPLRRTSTTTSSLGGQARPPSPFPGAEAPSNPSSSGTDRASGSRLDGSSSSTLRQRRRSESHGHLGSGAARRNGVVEPDRDSTGDTTAPSNGRHWLIYVVGTNLAEDHPAFQAPSLFTDNPSYEDMVMLSTLLGPVKPPVATAEEVAAATGTFRLELRRSDGTWTARAMDREPGAGHGVPAPLEVFSSDVVKCTVCQSDFESGEEVRRLLRCRHVYHRECIDVWLTTGRNSCPVCRTTGVEVEEMPRAQSSTAE